MEPSTASGSSSAVARASGADRQNGQLYEHLSVLRHLDPFHPWSGEEADLLVMHLQGGPGSLTAQLSVPRLRAWRRMGREVWLLSMRLTQDGSMPDEIHSWPRSLVFKINDKEVFKVDPPTLQKKRRDLPLEVSAMLRPAEDNIIDLSWLFPRRDRFLLVFALTLRLTPENLFEKVQSRPQEMLLAQSSRVRALLAEDSKQNNDEVSCSSRRRLSLVCPISHMRIEVPARGKACRHVQCFDLSAYLISNQKMSVLAKRWQCAVCNCTVKPSDLVVDRFNVEVLKSAPCDVDVVTLDEHGRWSVEKEFKDVEPCKSKLQRCLSARAIMENGSHADLELCPSPSRVRRRSSVGVAKRKMDFVNGAWGLDGQSDPSASKPAETVVDLSD